MRYALIKNGLVANVIEADAAFAAAIESEWDAVVIAPDAHMGSSFVNGAILPPDPTPAPAPIRVITKLEYMNRFTDAELAAIYSAAKVVVVQVEIWLEKFKLASEINLDDPVTAGGLQAMESAGLIGSGRAAEILA